MRRWKVLKRKRRWFQFSLRTLLIAVTLLAVPLGYAGWQAKISRGRAAAVTEVMGSGGMVIGAEGLSPSKLASDRDYSIPFLRRWMGDHAVLQIFYKRGTTDDDVRRLRRLFPEARIDELDYLDPPPATQP
jgi:hypothetical protein